MIIHNCFVIADFEDGPGFKHLKIRLGPILAYVLRAHTRLVEAGCVTVGRRSRGTLLF